MFVVTKQRLLGWWSFIEGSRTCDLRVFKMMPQNDIKLCLFSFMLCILKLLRVFILSCTSLAIDFHLTAYYFIRQIFPIHLKET